MKVTLLIFTLNEIDGVKEIMPRVKKEWVDEIIVVDNSTDGTREYFESNGYTVLGQKEPNGVNAWLTGFAAATGDVIILFSPDGNSIPEVIPQLVDKMREGYDMVIASRYKDNARSYDDTLMTGFGNWMFTKMINKLFKANYTDALVMYRAFKKELINKSGFTNNHWTQNFEVVGSIRSAKLKLNVTEIPASEPIRIGPGGSRAFPGIKNKLKGGSIMFYIILRELLFWR